MVHFGGLDLRRPNSLTIQEFRLQKPLTVQKAKNILLTVYDSTPKNNYKRRQQLERICLLLDDQQLSIYELRKVIHDLISNGVIIKEEIGVDFE